MLISCRFSFVGLQLLLLTHIAHSFVLLTANVDDVKKIARKFVSDSLAEKIADFIARATETIAQNTKISEENENNSNVRGSSEVSAENRMYNVEKHGFDSLVADAKSKEETVLGKVTVKVPKNTLAENKRHGLGDTGTTHKPRKESKPLQGRSRYIVQSEKSTQTTEKALSKIIEKDKYNKMKESIQLLDDNLSSTPNGKTKAKKQKKKIKGRAYKLLSGFETVENDAAKDGSLDSKGLKEDERFFNVRAMDEEKLLSLPTEVAVKAIEQHVIEKEKQHDIAVSLFHQSDIKDDKNTEKVHTNVPVNLTGKNEFDHDENKIIHMTDKLVTSGSPSFVAETDDKKVNWWEKELPANHEVKGKSWF